MMQSETPDRATMASTTARSHAVPSTALLDFFRAASEQLKQHPHVPISATADGDNDTPPSLEEQRRLLLRIQLNALEETLERYNEEAKSTNDGGSHKITLHDAQEALRQLGGEDFGHVSLDSDEEKLELLAASSAMNDAARSAFARSILLAELDWDRGLGDDDGGGIEDAEKGRGLRDGSGGERGEKMNRDAVIEFCGLCTAAVGLAEVQAYLRHGTDTAISANNGGGILHRKLGRRERLDGTTVPPERMERLHRLLFRAVGYQAQFAKAEIQRLLFPSEEDSGNGDTSLLTDPELDEAFRNFLTATSVAATNAAVGTAGSGGGGEDLVGDGILSDRDAGGVTRVVSVKYSERTVDVAPGETDGASSSSSGVVPPAQSMDQRDEDRQRQQLAMAREAAALQRGILEELLAMDADKRDATLMEAKEANNAFVKEVLEIPAGQERLDFLQSIDPARQRLLAVHKLWESYLASG